MLILSNNMSTSSSSLSIINDHANKQTNKETNRQTVERERKDETFIKDMAVG